jgi:rSAM/selenodomain-associated transferase 2
MPQPGLSIIIPTLNEEENLPLLLTDLVSQQGIDFEVIVADGGSVDATCQRADALFTAGELHGFCLRGPCGRGRQMNDGASGARSDWLLFLHADSRLENGELLKNALEYMHNHQRTSARYDSAGHFPLRFDLSEAKLGLGLYFHEAKTVLGRVGCIHGDQGMLIPKALFRRIKQFREDLPIMEDTDLAEKVRATGEWVLLPGHLVTSARRFQVEGLKARQTLNALMMNFLAIGWLDFFHLAPAIYRQQMHTQPLQLRPFFTLIQQMLRELPPARRWSVWLATGKYVRSQLWQIGLLLDCRRNYRNLNRVLYRPGGWLKFFDRWLDPFTNHCLGRGLATMLVWLWFHWQVGTLPKPSRCKGVEDD